MSLTTTTKFEILYNTYSAILYRMSLDICPSVKQAEEILIITFQKAHQQHIEKQESSSICLSLIKLLIKTAHEQLNNNQGNTNFKLKNFENYPMMHHILCEQATAEHYCAENNISRQDLGKKLRNEFLLLRGGVTQKQKLSLTNT